MAVAAAAVAIAGTAITVYGQIQEGQAKADAAKKQAALNEQQAEEILARARINENALSQDYAQLMDRQSLGFAKAGIDVAGASPLAFMEGTATKFRMEAANLREESNYRANNVRLGGQMALDQGSQYQQAAGLSAAGSALTGLNNAYTASGGSKSSPSSF